MNNYTVQPGDTLSQIAKRLNVPMQAISGYKSGDPNAIFPGEVLSIGQIPGAQPSPQPAQPTQATDLFPNGFTAGMNNQPAPAQQPLGQPQAPQQPVAAPAAAPVAPVQPQAIQQPQAQPMAAAPVQPVVGQQNTEQSQKVNNERDALLQELANRNPELADTVMDTLGFDRSPASGSRFRTPSGASISVTPDGKTTVEDQKKAQADTYFGQFGVPSEALEVGFQTNPTGTLSDLIRLVMESTGMPDARENVAKISKEIEDLSNERDRLIAESNDNPFISAGSKAERAKKISDDYERRIANRTNRLTLMQNAYSDAQQQAQFAATTAISLFDKQRTFDQKRIDDALNRAERQAEAERKTAEFEAKAAQPIEVSAGATIYDPKTGRAIFRAPENTKAGDVAAPGEYSSKQLTALNRINENVSKNQTYARTSSMRGYVDNVITALGQRTGVSDIAAINQFQKVIDEGAVTRDQDVKLIQGAQSAANRFKTLISRLESGQQLSETQRSEMRTLVEDLYTSQLEALKKDSYIKSKITEATKNNIDPVDTILGEILSSSSSPETPPVPAQVQQPPAGSASSLFSGGETPGGFGGASQPTPFRAPSGKTYNLPY